MRTLLVLLFAYLTMPLVGRDLLRGEVVRQHPKPSKTEKFVQPDGTETERVVDWDQEGIGSTNVTTEKPPSEHGGYVAGKASGLQKQPEAATKAANVEPDPDKAQPAKTSKK